MVEEEQQNVKAGRKERKRESEEIGSVKHYLNTVSSMLSLVRLWLDPT